MCEPGTMSAALPIVLSAGSAVAGTAYNWHVANEQEKATQAANAQAHAARMAERDRQQAFSSEAMSNWEQTRGRLTEEEHAAQREKHATDIAARIESLGAGNEAGMISSQPRSSEAVRTVIARQTQQAAAKSREQINAAAQLGAYDMAAQDRGIELTQNADLLSTLAGLRRGSLGASAAETQVPAASVSANPWIQGSLAVAQAVGQSATQNAGFNAGFGG